LARRSARGTDDGNTNGGAPGGKKHLRYVVRARRFIGGMGGQYGHSKPIGCGAYMAVTDQEFEEERRRPYIWGDMTPPQSRDTAGSCRRQEPNSKTLKGIDPVLPLQWEVRGMDSESDRHGIPPALTICPGTPRNGEVAWEQLASAYKQPSWVEVRKRDANSFGHATD